MKENSLPVSSRLESAAVWATRIRTSRLLVLVGLLAILLVAPSAALAETTGRLVLHNKTFRCGDYSQPLRLTLLRVTMSRASGGDAIGLNRGDCRGYIRRIEVKTWARDGVKVGRRAHDIVIGGGYIRCYGRSSGAHQDAIQVMGGRRITFRRVVTRCGSSNHSSFFVNAGTTNPSPPRAVICNYCDLRGGSTTVHIGQAIRSGVKNSVVYAGRYTAFRGNPRVDVWRNNRVVPYSG
jgi:hypothetical protein